MSLRADSTESIRRKWLACFLFQLHKPFFSNELVLITSQSTYFSTQIRKRAQVERHQDELDNMVKPMLSATVQRLQNQTYLRPIHHLTAIGTMDQLRSDMDSWPNNSSSHTYNFTEL